MVNTEPIYSGHDNQFKLLHLTYELMTVKKTEEVLNYNNYGDELL